MAKNKLWKSIFIIAICIILFSGCRDMGFNQKTSKNDLITVRYSVAQIEEIINTKKNDIVTFSEFEKSFETQCIRKTYQGYYAVLLLDDGRNAFAFFNEKNELIRIMLADKFVSKNEFQSSISKQMKKSDVLDFDSNSILLPISSIDNTAHIVQEGVFIVKYSRIIDGELVKDPVVSTIDYIENEDIPENEDSIIRTEIPFILELDKKAE